MSRLHQVLAEPSDGRVPVRDLDGGRHVISMLAFEGEVPRPGQWLVAHSGFALCPADDDDVAVAVAEWAAAREEAT